jgi:hypothetical protein
MTERHSGPIALAVADAMVACSAAGLPDAADAAPADVLGRAWNLLMADPCREAAVLLTAAAAATAARLPPALNAPRRHDKNAKGAA